MSEKIVQLNEEVIKGQLKELVRGSVEETLNELLEQEAERLTQAARYERNECALTFVKSRSKRYVACSDVVRPKGLYPIRYNKLRKLKTA